MGPNNNLTTSINTTNNVSRSIYALVECNCNNKSSFYFNLTIIPLINR